MQPRRRLGEEQDAMSAGGNQSVGSLTDHSGNSKSKHIGTQAIPKHIFTLTHAHALIQHTRTLLSHSHTHSLTHSLSLSLSYLHVRTNTRENPYPT
jgi:hypothetical protein